MFPEFFARYGTELIAAIILLPVLVFNVALFLERTRFPRWGDAQRGATTRRPPPVATGGGGLGLRRVTAAKHEHD